MESIPMYRLEVVYGIDEDGDHCVSTIFENLVSPEEHVPFFHKMGLAGEAQVAALADTFEPQYYPQEDEED